ncbi:MAG: WVD2 family protein, partial [Nanoarchaeota archaeon]|nr:WVD2 family protein [Nanoarchaeota archaeon]
KGFEQLGRCYSQSCHFSDSSVVWRLSTSCRTLNPPTYCQDSSCGCREGFGECEDAGMCVKKAAVENNQPCKCNFQCMSGYCEANICRKTVTVTLSATKSLLDITDASQISLSISNDLDEDVDMSLQLNLGSGALMTGSIFGANDCSGNQCKAVGTLRERGRKDITIQINPQQSGIINFSSSIKITLQNGLQINLPEEELNLQITMHGDGVCNPETGESQNTYCRDCPCQKGNPLIAIHCQQTSQERAWGHDYSCVSAPTALLFILIGLVIIPIVVLIVFRRNFYDMIEDRRQEKERLEQERKQKEGVLKKQEEDETLRREGEEAEEKKKIDEGKKTSGEEVKKRVSSIIKQGERGRGISLDRITRKMPYIPGTKVQNALDELVDKGFVEEVNRGVFYKKENVPKKELSLEQKVVEAVKGLDRGRGVSLKRLTKKLGGLSEGEVKKVVDSLVKKGSLKDLGDGLYRKV